MEPLAFRKLLSKTCVRRSGEEKGNLVKSISDYKSPRNPFLGSLDLTRPLDPLAALETLESKTIDGDGIARTEDLESRSSCEEIWSREGAANRCQGSSSSPPSSLLNRFYQIRLLLFSFSAYGVFDEISILKEALAAFDDCKWTAVYALLGDIGDISTAYSFRYELWKSNLRSMMECDMKAMSIGTKRKYEVLDTCLQQMMKACFLDFTIVSGLVSSGPNMISAMQFLGLAELHW
ncbi:hypothetical protein Sjap_018097 [Stephania japonica]|uniref:Uncharacterized protein n=1 Tax=Stephania japonica TaxID=461633 RepID=A0AAP0I7F2_9MAGN